MPIDTSRGLIRTRIAGTNSLLSTMFERIRVPGSTYASVSLPYRQLYGAKIELRDDDGEGYWGAINIADQLFAVINNCRYREPRSEYYQGEGFLEFHFRLSGMVRLKNPGVSNVDLSDPSIFVCRTGASVGYDVSYEPGFRDLKVSVFCLPGFLTRTFLPGRPAGRTKLNALLSLAHDQVQFFELMFTSGLIVTTRQLLNVPLNSAQSLLYAEAKILELMCDCMSLLEHASNEATNCEALSRRDIRQLECARDILMTQFSPAPTIPHLAKRVGLNATKLKRGFRMLYGSTVFDVGHSYRMQHALRLLCEDRSTITAAAAAIGYSHPTTFSTAFRSYFGFAPKHARAVACLRQELSGQLEEL
ncbi:MAG: helix-turn-helix domain-containing protein [Dehalococcoidia bacterium]